MINSIKQKIISGQHNSVAKDETTSKTETTSKSESVFNKNSDTKTENGSSFWENKALDVTCSLRKASVGNLVTLSQMNSSQTEELTNQHGAISDECWDKINSLRKGDQEVTSGEIDKIINELKTKFMDLINKENTALEKLKTDKDETEGT